MLSLLSTHQKRTDSLPNERVHYVLSNERRKRIIEHVQERGELSKRELVDRMAEQEYGLDQSGVSAQERKRIAVAVHQSHLPVLDDHDIIEYDGRTIREGPHMHAVDPFMNPRQRSLLAF